MFSFASKMLNTLMGDDNQQQQQQQPTNRAAPTQSPARPTNSTNIGPPRMVSYQQQQSNQPKLQQMAYPRPTRPQIQPPLQKNFRGPEEPHLDLSHLSPEERMLIQNVMAKAKDLDKAPKIQPSMDQNQYRVNENNSVERQGVNIYESMQQHQHYMNQQQQQMLGDRQQNSFDSLRTTQQSFNTTNGYQQNKQAFPDNHSLSQVTQVPVLGVNPSMAHSQQQPCANSHSNQIGQKCFGNNQGMSSQIKQGYSNNVGYSNSQQQQISQQQQQQQQQLQQQQLQQQLQQQQLQQQQHKDVVAFQQSSMDSKLQSLPVSEAEQQLEQQQNLEAYHNMANLKQRVENMQIKQEVHPQIENPSSPITLRKEYGLMRQDSYSLHNQNTPNHMRKMGENGDKELALLEDGHYTGRGGSPSPPEQIIMTPPKDDLKIKENLYEHSPGEVYTIPEEEDEISSPTSDGVTSLRKTRLAGSQMLKKDDSHYNTLGSSNQHLTNNNFISQPLLNNSPHSIRILGKEEVRKPNGSTMHKLQGSIHGNTHGETYGNVHVSEHSPLHSSSMGNMHENPHHNNMFTKPPNYNTTLENTEDISYGKMVYRKNDLNSTMLSSNESNEHRFEAIEENGDSDKLAANQNNIHSQKQTVGTISGMLADFSRALGLSNPSPPAQYPEDKGNDNQSFASELNPPNYQQNVLDHLHGSVWPNEQMHQNKSGFFSRNDHFPSSHKSQMKPESIQGEMKCQNPRDQINQRHETMHGYEQLTQEQSHQQQQQQQQQQLQQMQKHQAQLQQVQLQQQQAQIQLELVQQQQQHQQHLQQVQQMMMQQQQQQVVSLQQQRAQQEYEEAEQQKQAVLQGTKTPLQGLLFGQHLTQQQQLMYQQHMQLQHQAQHLKKVKRSLPHSTNDPQKQVQVQKKDATNWSVVGHGGGGVTIQQMVAAQLLSQPCLPVQVVASDSKASHRLIPATSPPNITSTTTHQFANSGVTPMGTPQSTPVSTPRGAKDGGDSSDTMSETDSQKSLRTRRKLPSIPSDQEAVTLQNVKKKDRVKCKSHDKFSRPYSPLRQYSDGSYKISTPNLMLQRPSSSETNLRKVNSYGPDIPRPGSALGLLQGSSVVSSSGICLDYSRDSEIASCLPPDLRHLLSTYKTSDNTYSKQEHLVGDIKVPITERRGINRLNHLEWEADRLLQRNQDVLQNPKNRLEMQRKMVYSGLGRTRKVRAHRRQLSDPKILLEMSQIKNGNDVQYNRALFQGLYGSSHPSLCPPYKSYEYESIDGGKLGEWESSQHPYLNSYAVAGGALRETAINSVLDKEIHNDSMRYEMRRYSDGLEIGRRGFFKGHRPRSWQPSPYGSDEEDDSLSREQKKAKIKAEIARRRQQIEENARLHEELLRLARLRESAELGYAPLRNNSSLTGDYAMSSVLKSIDDLIGSQQLGDYSNHRTAEDRSMDRIASTFRTDDYTSGVYERLSDFSPITDYSAPHAMPLLPDMPTRSRKLLEDLGSSPITESVLVMQQKG